MTLGNIISRKIIALATISMAFAVLSGCSTNKMAARVASGLVNSGLDTVFSQSDTEYVKEALPSNLQLMEIMLAADPGNRKLLTNAAMGFCGYSLMFLEEDSPKRASVFYQKGQDYAKKALLGKKTEDIDLKKLGKKDAPALFWHTFCKANYLNLNKHRPAAIAQLPSLEPEINRLEELDPEYYYNGAYILKGAFYAIRPRMFGGNPEKAKEYFEKALKGKGEGFLMTKYEYAKMAAPADLDEELFDRLISEILSAEIKDGPERLANEAAKIKAKKLQEQKDDIF